VVIGGGVLGLGAAWELSKSGCSVAVLEALPTLMPRQLDAAAASMLTGIAQAKGLKLVTNAKVAGITEDSVVLADGQSFKADLVIVSCGVKANVKIAAEAGITADRAVLVDDHMRTNVDGIYACGDSASFLGVNYALWEQAVEMGRIAGANAAGDDVAYSPVSGALTFNGLGTSLFAVGDNGKDPSKKYRTVELSDQQRKSYEKYYFINNRLSGVILLGDVSKMAEVTEAVEKHLRFSEVIKF
jgi:NAD(P)H-nitrite reductase large subunit